MFTTLTMLGLFGACTATATAYAGTKLHASGDLRDVAGSDARVVLGMAAIGAALMVGLTGAPGLLTLAAGIGLVASWATTMGFGAAAASMSGASEAAFQPIYG